MGEPELIDIEVAGAWPDKQIIRSVQISAGTSARQALRLSGLAEEFSMLDVETVPLGIFGQVVADDYMPRAGERIEVYRPLRQDPREARKQRCS